jgi:hypothetical protein
MDPDKFLSWAKARQDPLEIADLIIKTSENFTEANKFSHRIALRSFLRSNGFNNLTRENTVYTVQDWHRAYKREEVKKVLGYLDSKLHKLYVYGAVESGFRAKTVLALRYHHIEEDFEDETVPCAIRLEPKFYKGKKPAGFSFLGQRSVDMLKECIKDGLVKKKPDSPLIPLAYSTVFEVVVRARDKAGIDPKVQPNHGFRKYFESALDKAELDVDKKHLLEGHFADTRAKHYTGREWNELRPLYQKAYPFIDPEGSSPEVATEIGELERQLLEKDKRIEQLEALVGVKKKGNVSFTVQDQAVGMNILDEIRNIKKWIESQRKKQQAP